jgi:crotonobetainyl-CoA:carnitine CoA-transferase CaiB-like acyl-CoA transferase
MTDSEKPLSGLRIADLSRVLAGPYATQRLADLGAEVIKVERPGQGDETRTWGPPFQAGQASYFLSVNRGKRSIALDLQSPDGREVALDLCSASDVVIHNFRPGVMERLGLGHADIASVNPKIVSCRITGFGVGREPAERPGYDLLVQAESGLMDVTGFPDGPPTRVGVAVIDVLTGLEAATAILAALAGRERTGTGCEIDVSLLDSALSGLVNVAQGAIATGQDPKRQGGGHPSIVPYQLFEAADGRIVVTASNDGLWLKLCEAIDRPDLSADKRFLTNPGRVANREILVPILEQLFASQTADTWVERLQLAGVPAGRVRGVRSALDTAEATGRRATIELGIDQDEVELIAPPALFDGEALHANLRPPKLGEHTDEVLTELGRTAVQIAELRSSGTVA